MEAFRAWVVERKGQRVELDATDAANRMLVVWIFELLQDEPIRQFAANFKNRLKDLKLYDLARAILAVNALELPAPTKLVESMSDEQRDAFEELCSKTQLHFEKVESATDCSQDIGFRILRLIGSSTRVGRGSGTLAQHWGRDLAISLVAAARNDDWSFASELISSWARLLSCPNKEHTKDKQRLER